VAAYVVACRPMKTRASLLALALGLVVACDKGSQGPDPNTSGAPPPAAGRTALVPQDHPHYARFEAPSAQNACDGDAACAKGGCSGEVCAAEQVITTCEVLDVQIPASAACGCVSGQCVWYTSDGTTLPASGGGGGGSGGEPGPGSPVTCGDKTCAPGEQCISYYGIAGPSGPMFHTCGIPCRRGKGENDGCPAGKRCVTIADGPGDVCQ